jgi:hypothetical protein
MVLKVMAGLGNAIVNQICDQTLIQSLNNQFQIVVEKPGKHASRQSILKESFLDSQQNCLHQANSLHLLTQQSPLPLSSENCDVRKLRKEPVGEHKSVC